MVGVPTKTRRGILAEFDSLPVSASPPSLLTMRNMVGDFEGVYG